MAAPDIITHAGPLLGRYDLLLCDVWGVVHDGRRAHPAACEALARFRRDGGTVVLVSNAPMPCDAVARVLDDKKVDRAAWDAIVSSGDLALTEIKERGYRRLHRIGPPGRDDDFFERLPGPDAPVATAEAIACTGLRDDRSERSQQYLPVLEAARARDLPFVCVNPDLVVHVGEDLLECAGAIATIYERLGGSVFWAGKPHPVAYATAIARAERLRGSLVGRSRILAIGDAVRTDLAAAKGAGVDALFIASGIHREETMAGGQVDGAAVNRLVAAAGVEARAAAAALVW